MVIITAKTKKWGNSTGIVIPRELGIPPGKNITIDIKPQHFTTVGDVFGLLRKHNLRLKKSTAQLMAEIDRELE